LLISPGSANRGPLAWGPVFQVGIVVADLERALRAYSALWDVGPWRCYTFSPATVSKLQYHGTRAEYSMLVALTNGAPQLELIQPLEGPSIYEDHLRERGEGLHHLAVYVDSIEDAVAELRARGHSCLAAGWGFSAVGDGAFAYFDTARDLGLILEVVQAPTRMREPDYLWPGGSKNQRPREGS
jgi:catechol 2,3-dioxygenase-like lactoylglutathione lyase family enzyme